MHMACLCTRQAVLDMLLRPAFCRSLLISGTDCSNLCPIELFACESLVKVGLGCPELPSRLSPVLPLFSSRLAAALVSPGLAALHFQQQLRGARAAGRGEPALWSQFAYLFFLGRVLGPGLLPLNSY